MPHTISTKYKKRQIIAKMHLMINAERYKAGVTRREGTIGCAVRVYATTNRLIDESTIAKKTFLPRSSVIRALKSLEGRGFIRSERRGNRVVYFPNPDGENDSIIEEFFRNAESAIRRAARELSTLVIFIAPLT